MLFMLLFCVICLLAFCGLAACLLHTLPFCCLRLETLETGYWVAGFPLLT